MASAKRMMSMSSSMWQAGLNIMPFQAGCASLSFAKIPKVRYVAGGIEPAWVRSSSMSCRLTRRYSVFRTAGIRPPLVRRITLPCRGGLVIRVVSPAYFIATKFEAFAGRGKGDYFSHDLEDIVFVMENRQRLIVELMDAPQGLKQYFSEQATKLLNEDFMNVLPGLLNNPASAKSVENSLKIMSGWGN